MLIQMREFPLWVADMEGCPLPGYPAKIHAAKQPCHAAVVGYTTKEKIAPTHPEYLSAVRGSHGNELVLNIIDPELPLFRIEVFQQAVEFIDSWISRGPVLVHCNQGLSRAPSIVLLWLAKRAEAINGWGFSDAREAFTKEFMPSYAPRKGITTFLTEKWGAIR